MLALPLLEKYSKSMTGACVGARSAGTGGAGVSSFERGAIVRFGRIQRGFSGGTLPDIVPRKKLQPYIFSNAVLLLFYIKTNNDISMPVANIPCDGEMEWNKANNNKKGTK